MGIHRSFEQDCDSIGVAVESNDVTFAFGHSSDVGDGQPPCSLAADDQMNADAATCCADEC